MTLPESRSPTRSMRPSKSANGDSPYDGDWQPCARQTTARQNTTSRMRASSPAAPAPGYGAGVNTHRDGASRGCQLVSLGWKLNFCPPMLASYIKPPLATVNTATPALYLALAEAPSAAATALTCASIVKCPPLNDSSASLLSKKMISEYCWPPSCAPTVTCVSDVVPITAPCWITSPSPCAAPTPIAPFVTVGNMAYPAELSKNFCIDGSDVLNVETAFSTS